MTKEGLMAIAVLVLFALVVLSKVESLWARVLLIGIVAWVGYSNSALMAMMVAGVLAVLVLVNPWRRRGA